MQVGDLVKTKFETPLYGGYGIIVEVSDENSEAKVRWLDDFKIGSPVTWNRIWMLEVVSEGR